MCSIVSRTDLESLPEYDNIFFGLRSYKRFLDRLSVYGPVCCYRNILCRKACRVLWYLDSHGVMHQVLARCTLCMNVSVLFP
jgi:hypothetical protein